MVQIPTSYYATDEKETMKKNLLFETVGIILRKLFSNYITRYSNQLIRSSIGNICENVYPNQDWKMNFKI